MSTPSDPRTPADAATPRQSSTQEIPVPPPTAPQPAPPADGPQPTGPVDFVPGPPSSPVPAAQAPAPATPPAAPVLPPPPGAAPPVPVAPQPVPSEPVPVQPAAAGPAPDGTPPAGPAWPESLDDDAAQARTSKVGRIKVRKEKAAADGTSPASRSRDPRAVLGLGLVTLALVLLEVGLLLDFGGRSYWSAVTLWSAFATACALLALLAFAAFYPAGNRLRSGPAWRVAAGGLVGLAAFWLLVVLPEVASDRGFVLTASLAALGGALWIGPRRKD